MINQPFAAHDIPSQENIFTNKLKRFFSPDFGPTLNGKYSTDLPNIDSITLISRPEHEDAIVMVNYDGVKKVSFMLGSNGELLAGSARDLSLLRNYLSLSENDVEDEVKKIIDEMVPDPEKEYRVWSIDHPLVVEDEGGGGNGGGGGGERGRGEVPRDSRRIALLRKNFPDVFTHIEEKEGTRSSLSKSEGYRGFVAPDKLIYETDKEGNALYIIPLIDHVDPNNFSQEQVENIVKSYGDNVKKKDLVLLGAVPVTHPDSSLPDEEYSLDLEKRIKNAYVREKNGTNLKKELEGIKSLIDSAK